MIKECKVCGELMVDVHHSKIYCDNCVYAVRKFKVKKNIQEQRKKWDEKSEEEQLKLMEKISKRFLYGDEDETVL